MKEKTILRNCYGEILDPNIQRKLIKPEFGKVNENGRIIPNWTEENDDVDNKGFDKHNIEENGCYVLKWSWQEEQYYAGTGMKKVFIPHM